MRSEILIMVVFSVVATVSSVSYSSVIHEEWTGYKLTYNKQYNEVEDAYRKKIYTQNKYKIAKHNQKYARGAESYYLKLNQYADLDHDEFVRIISGYNNTLKGVFPPKPPAHFVNPANVAVPAHMDWRELGAVTPVKDQELCASCWAFSATGALEGQYFRQTSSLVPLSEQNLVDCSRNWGNEGCYGGLMQYAYSYVNDNGGIDTEEQYPYDAVASRCRYNKSYAVASDVGYVFVTGGDELLLKEAVASMGPVSVGIDAMPDTFQLYGGGVYYDTRCSSTTIKHAMLVVGYGVNMSSTVEEYWILKNSMGLSWGLDGYMLMARNRGNHCGIATDATYPIV